MEVAEAWADLGVENLYECNSETGKTAAKHNPAIVFNTIVSATCSEFGL